MPKRPPQEINASSMADIAFLLLVFFLVTTTMDSDWGLQRVLPPPITEEDPNPPKIKDRNIFVVLANANDQLLVEGELMDITQLREAAKEFIENAKDDPNLPEKVDTQIPFFGNYRVSKQVISLQNDNGTSYDLYINVQNELAAAYNDLREELAMKKFGASYSSLIEKKENDKVKAIRSIYPSRISEAEPKNVGGDN